MTVEANRTTRRVLGALAAAVLVVGMTPATASADDPDPRIGLGAGWLDAQTAISNLSCSPTSTSRRASSTPPTRATSGSSPRTSRSAATTRSWATSTASTSSTSRTRPRPTVVTSVVCPGGQGDVSVHGNLLFMSVEESPGPGRLRHEPDRRHPLPGRAHLRRQRRGQPGAGGGRADLPRLAHPLGGDRPGRPRQRLRLRLRHRRRRGRRRRWPAATTNPADRREPVAVAHRGHQGPARRTRPRPRSSASPRLFTDPATGAIDGLQNAAADAAAPVGHAVGSHADHRRLPRHHRVPGDRAGRRRLRGQRHPDRHLATPPTRSGSTRSPTPTSRTGTRRRSTTTARR